MNKMKKKIVVTDNGNLCVCVHVTRSIVKGN